MPKGAKKAGARNGRNAAQQSGRGDFTLYDFAHAKPGEVPPQSGRMKKGMAGSIAETGVDTLAWYEKDLSDFDLSDEEENEDTLNNNGRDVEDSAETSDTGTPTRFSKKKPPRKEMVVAETGVTYPLDLWYILGDYIFPENIITFAQLCQNSHHVVHTAGFWYRLYMRHYDSSLELPSHLLPQCIQRMHGIRPRVIASLFYMYPPFIERMRAMAPMESDPDQLIGARCILMWYTKVKSLWHFFFKFRRPSKKRCSLAQKDTCTMQQDLHKADNIDYNPEDNCCILQVVLQNFVSLPPTVMGQILAKTFVSVGHGMRFHKVKLVFSSEYMDANDKNALASGTTLSLDPVLNVHVSHWWSPKYPHYRR